MNIGNNNLCPICKIGSVFSAYVGNREWQYTCQRCGQYFKMNAVSQRAADRIYNTVIGGDIKCQENLVVESLADTITEN